jgi:ABC-2 type transport system permease protein
VLSTILFYSSPILYPSDVAPPEFQDLIALNPLTPIFEQTREWIIDPNAPGAAEAVAGKEWLLAISLGITAAICFLGPWVFNRMAPRVAEEL